MAEKGFRSVEQIASSVRRGDLSCVELATSALEAAGALNGELRAFLALTPDRALERARELDARRRRGEPLGPLAGVPIAIKDNLAEAGERLSCASRILEGYRSPYTATAVARCLEAGAVPIGRTNLDEFSMGSSTENSAFGPTRNPWDLGRVPGGSSGGSAAAVASRIVPLALGSDTGGSIRQPAAFCGVVGLKPTYGRVSRWGLVAFASSLDQVGPLALGCRDVALALEVLGGPDGKDATCSANPSGSYLEEIEAGGESLRWGTVEELDLAGCDLGVREAWDRALGILESFGCPVESVSIPEIEASLECYYLIATSEASSNLARYDGVRYGSRVRPEVGDWIAMYEGSRARGFGAEVKRRVLLGTFALSVGYYDAYYGRACQVVGRLRERLEKVWNQVDVLVLPTTPTVAFPLGSRLEDPLTMYLSDIFTTPANLAGLPALSLPMGLDRDGLPVAVQLMAAPFRESTLLRAARALEREVGPLPAPRVRAPEP